MKVELASAINLFSMLSGMETRRKFLKQFAISSTFNETRVRIFFKELHVSKEVESDVERGIWSRTREEYEKLQTGGKFKFSFIKVR